MRTNLPERLKKALVYIILVFGIYVALPFAAMGMGRADLYNYLVPILDWCAVFAVGFSYGKRNGRDPVLPAACAVMFIPVMFFFYYISAWVHIPILALCCFFGQCLGNLYRGRAGR